MSAPAKSGAQYPSRAIRWLGYLLSIVCLTYVLYDIHPSKALHELSNVSWRWVLLGMMLDVVSYAVQGIRWKLLLRPFGEVRLTHSVRAVFAGIFANMVFPLRPGEFLRSYLLSQSEGISIGRVLGSVGVERLVDLVATVASLGVVSLFVTLPVRLRRAAVILGIIALVLVVLFLAAILYLEIRLGSESEEQMRSSAASGKLVPALAGLHAMGTSPRFYPAVLVSLGTPLCQVFGLWFMMKAYGLELSFAAALVVLLVINLGVSLPNAPANVGAYQFFCVVGLGVFDVEKTSAAGFSIFAFVMLTLPFLFLGFWAVLRSGLSIQAMRERIRGAASESAKPA